MRIYRFALALWLALACLGAAFADMTPDQQLGQAILGGKAARVSQVLAANPGIANQVSSSGSTPLVTAATLKTDPAVIEALIRGGADPNLACPSGMTPLVAAISMRRTQCVKALLERGADANKAGPVGRTPLITAVLSGGKKDSQTPVTLVQTLLAAKADPNQADASGMNALQYAVSLARSNDRMASQLVGLMIRAGADPKRSFKVTTPQQTVTITPLELLQKMNAPLTLAVIQGAAAP